MRRRIRRYVPVTRYALKIADVYEFETWFSRKTATGYTNQPFPGRSGRCPYSRLSLPSVPVVIPGNCAVGRCHGNHRPELGHNLKTKEDACNAG